MKQLLGRNEVSLASDGWTSTNKLVITSVIAYYIDQNCELQEVRLAFGEVDRMFYFHFERQLWMIGQGTIYWSKESGAFEGRA